jgi:hypothetical protein
VTLAGVLALLPLPWVGLATWLILRQPGGAG